MAARESSVGGGRCGAAHIEISAAIGLVRALQPPMTLRPYPIESPLISFLFNFLLSQILLMGSFLHLIPSLQPRPTGSIQFLRFIFADVFFCSKSACYNQKIEAYKLVEIRIW
jgi:hypothetical protein